MDAEQVKLLLGIADSHRQRKNIVKKQQQANQPTTNQKHSSLLFTTYSVNINISDHVLKVMFSLTVICF